MTDGIQLRNAESGVVLGSAAFPVADQQVMVFDLASGLWFAEDLPTSGGSVTPLSGVRVTDDGSVTVTPNGGFSQDVAFATMQESVDDLSPSGGTVILAGGTYDEDITIPGKFVFRGLGGLVNSALGTTIAGDFAQVDAASDVTVIDCNVPAAVNFHTGTIRFQGCAEVGAVDAGALVASETAFSDLVSAGVIQATHCGFSSDVAVVNSSTSEILDCAFAGDVQFDKAACTSSTFEGQITGDGSGLIVLTNCRCLGSTLVPLSWDATTELRSLKGAFDITGAAFMLALSAGQGGDADVQTGNANLNFSGRLRSIYCRGSLAANATVDFALTGGVAGQNTLYAIDMYDTAHHVDVTFGAAALVTMPAQTAGNGTRFWFGLNADGLAVSFLYSEGL